MYMENNNSELDMKPDCGCEVAPKCALCVGYAYVPDQEWGEVYSEAQALAAGTIFPCLNLPIDCYGKLCRAKGGICDD